MNGRMTIAFRSPLYIARHAETVFNHAQRMQGNDAHTPLTRHGIAQAEAMGAALGSWFRQNTGTMPVIWSSPAGRALQTAAIIAEHLDQNFFAIRQDHRLREIEVGRWTGRLYADIIAEEGEILDIENRLFRLPIPEGEDYAAIAARLRSWLSDVRDEPTLIISHGITSRVLRGLLTGGLPYGGVEIAANLPQGSVARITGGEEMLVLEGSGPLEAEDPASVSGAV